MAGDAIPRRLASLPEPGPATPEPVTPADGTARALRAAVTVLAGDAVLADVRRPDWAGLAAEHRREPFGRAQRRALIARDDCPDELARTLLTPWDSLVAARLVARRRPVPRWAWAAALERIGETRPAFLRQVLRTEPVDDLLHTVPRLDLLIRAVDGFDHNNHDAARDFWAAVGRVVHRHAGTDAAAWLALAAALPGHRGRLPSLLRQATDPTPTTPTGRADLRVLAQAPAPVLAGIVAGLPDAALAEMHDRDVRPRPARDGLTAMVLDQFAAAGVPSRLLFARWAYAAPQAGAEARAWTHGLDPMLDRLTIAAAEYRPELRRRLAALVPEPAPAADLVAALLASADAVRAEALLARAPEPLPWDRLLGAHLPGHVVCALAARADCPEELLRSLPADRLGLVAGHSPGAARAALKALDRVPHAFGVLTRVRAAAVLDDRELLSIARPVRHVLDYARTLPDDDPFVRLL